MTDYFFIDKKSDIITPSQAYVYATQKGTRVPELESLILEDLGCTFCYANDIIKSRWPEAEPILMKHSCWAFHYADDVIKGRWPEAEPTIIKNALYASCYAKDVLKTRWLEAEPKIMKVPEPWNIYLRSFPEARTLTKDCPLVLGKYAVMDVPNIITDEQTLQLVKLVCNDTSISINEIIRSRQYDEPFIKRRLEKNKLRKINIRGLKGQSKIGFTNMFVDYYASDFI